VAAGGMAINLMSVDRTHLYASYPYSRVSSCTAVAKTKVLQFSERTDGKKKMKVVQLSSGDSRAIAKLINKSVRDLTAAAATRRSEAL
jgi:hypothetical protein